MGAFVLICRFRPGNRNAHFGTNARPRPADATRRKVRTPEPKPDPELPAFQEASSNVCSKSDTLRALRLHRELVERGPAQRLMGAMLFGGVDAEHIQFNEDSL